MSISISGVRRLRRYYLSALCLMFLCPALLAEKLTVTIPAQDPTPTQHAHYFPQLLELALSKTEESDGPFELKQYPQRLFAARELSKLRSGAISVLWTMTDPEREKSFIPVRISLLRGLSSHRIFLIRAEDQEKFSQITSLDELKGFHGGLGDLWPDTNIMRANGLPVTTTSRYDLLFNMLTGKRFDYIPRGLYEVWEEYKTHKRKGLVIEDSLMLHYKGPNYFFVNKKDTALAERIERGLRLAQEDGSFDELFMSVPGFAQGLKEMANGKRRIFELEAPE